MNPESEKQDLYALIRSVNAEDSASRQSAFEELLRRYEPLLASLVAKYSDTSDTGLCHEDLYQEATVAFYHSILAYDTEQTEVEFGLYAKICISNALVSQLRKWKHRPFEPLVESEHENFFVHESEDPSEGILEQERVQALYLVIRNRLSPLEYRIWRYYMSGRTAKEIGTMVGKDEKSVSNAVYRIRKKLRAVLQSPV